MKGNNKRFKVEISGSFKPKKSKQTHALHLYNNIIHSIIIIIIIIGVSITASIA